MSNMNDFVIEKGVLKEYKGNDVVVTVPDGVVKIATGGLGNNTDMWEPLQEVILPDSVREINKNAFFSKDAKAFVKSIFETLDDYREDYLPKKMNMPKDYLKQPKLDLSLVSLLVQKRGLWEQYLTVEDCQALLKQFDKYDLPSNVRKLAEKGQPKVKKQKIEIPENNGVTLSGFYDPEPHREMEKAFLAEMKTEHPAAMIDSLKKQLYIISV